MQLAVVYSRAEQGVNAPLVTVETHLSNGVPSFSIVGLAEKAVKESKDRVRSAILNSGFEFPIRRITVNLAPADLPKESGRYDLAIALGILAASKQILAKELAHYEFAAELALSGELRGCRGSLPLALACQHAERALLVAKANEKEALLAEGQVYAASHLLQVAAHLNNQELLLPAVAKAKVNQPHHLDMQDIKGQPHARRALEIAAAGKHSLLMIGPPGTGKTMLASRLPSILPLANHSESLSIATVASISQQGFNANHWGQRPFRAPHHTASAVALAGGGSNPKPGEISLAHQGILFLDELPEFSRKALEVLREPLESGKVTISRANRHIEFPAKFQLIAAMNPCPCGYLGDSRHQCRCSPQQIQRYRAKLSGPLLDRIDMIIEVPALALSTLTNQQTSEESSQSVQQRVRACRQRQWQRASMANHEMDNRAIKKYCRLKAAQQSFLLQALEQLKLSARAYHRVLKVARTLADLHEKEEINEQHLAEALSYRRINLSVETHSDCI